MARTRMPPAPSAYVPLSADHTQALSTLDELDRTFDRDLARPLSAAGGRGSLGGAPAADVRPSHESATPSLSQLYATWTTGSEALSSPSRPRPGRSAHSRNHSHNTSLGEEAQRHSKTPLLPNTWFSAARPPPRSTTPHLNTSFDPPFDPTLSGNARTYHPTAAPPSTDAARWAQMANAAVGVVAAGLAVTGGAGVVAMTVNSHGSWPGTGDDKKYVALSVGCSALVAGSLLGLLDLVGLISALERKSIGINPGPWAVASSLGYLIQAPAIISGPIPQGPNNSWLSGVGISLSVACILRLGTGLIHAILGSRACAPCSFPVAHGDNGAWDTEKGPSPVSLYNTRGVSNHFQAEESSNDDFQFGRHGSPPPSPSAVMPSSRQNESVRADEALDSPRPSPFMTEDDPLSSVDSQNGLVPHHFELGRDLDHEAATITNKDLRPQLVEPAEGPLALQMEPQIIPKSSDATPMIPMLRNGPAYHVAVPDAPSVPHLKAEGVEFGSVHGSTRPNRKVFIDGLGSLELSSDSEESECESSIQPSSPLGDAGLESNSPSFASALNADALAARPKRMASKRDNLSSLSQKERWQLKEARAIKRVLSQHGSHQGSRRDLRPLGGEAREQMSYQLPGPRSPPSRQGLSATVTAYNPTTAMHDS